MQFVVLGQGLFALLSFCDIDSRENLYFILCTCIVSSAVIPGLFQGYLVLWWWVEGYKYKPDGW